MRHQALRPVALMLCLLLSAGAPVQADTIRLDDVVQTVNGGQRRQAPELRLRSISQRENTAAAANNSRTFAPGRANDPVAPAAPAGPTTTTSIISSGITTQQDGGNIETIDIGDVTGTVCDCGEIPPAPGTRGFPRWPLLFLPPLICLTGICDGDERRPPPDCIDCPPPDVIPEPATLLLFGTSLLALGAGARRRRQRVTAAKQGGESTTTGEEG